MTQDVISDVIAHGEGSTVEFKRSMTKDIGRALCAFANAGGGTILIGVSDAGKIVGVTDHNRLKSRMQSTARSADPQIEVDIESVGRVLRVTVPPQKRKPYSFGGTLLHAHWSEQSANVEHGGRRSILRGWTPSFRRKTPALISPSRTISMRKPGLDSATAPRSRKPWIGWWLSGISVYWTERTA